MSIAEQVEMQKLTERVAALEGQLADVLTRVEGLKLTEIDERPFIGVRMDGDGEHPVYGSRTLHLKDKKRG